MRTFGNVLWHFPFFGFLTAALYWLFGLLLTVTVIAAPIGLGLMQYAKFLLAPFSCAMVSKADLNVAQNPIWKTYSLIVMIIYLPFGAISVVLSAIQAILLCLTVVGIPVGLVVIKSLGTVLNPVGKVCVPAAVAAEVERRAAQGDVAKYLKA